MKFLFDLFPAILFFSAFKYGEKNQDQVAEWIGQILGSVPADLAPILFATITAMAATLIQIAWVALRHGKVGKMLWVSLILVVFFGGMTLAFRDPTFIKWKPTILYWIMAGSMLTAMIFKKNAIHLMLKDKVTLPEEVWMRLNLAWIGFLGIIGVLNLFVAYHYSTDTWVNFKLFGVTGLMFLFIIAQGFYLSRHIHEEDHS